MNCINCGAEIKAEYNNCPYCGKPIQMVPDYTIYDEDDINVILESTKDIPSKKEETKQEEIPVPEETKPKKKGKKIVVSAILLCIVLAGIGIGVKILIDKNNDNSYEYQMKLGDEALFKGKYDTAEEYYLHAIELSPNDVRVRLKLADVYLQKEKKEEAAVLLEEAILLDDTENYEAYKKLIDIYKAQGNTEAIVRLKKGVKEEKIRKLFADYIVNAPSIDLPSGTYSDDIKLSIIADEELEIFYTTDGTNPITGGTLYTGSIQLSNAGMHTVKTVARNSLGVYSDIVTQTFVISYHAPSDPEVSPNGGTFYVPTYVYINVPEGCSAYYTWDRTTPSTASEKYVSPLLVPEGYNILSVIIVNDSTGLSSSIYRDIFEYIAE